MLKIEIAVVVILIAAALIGVSMKKNEKVEVKTMEGMTVAKYFETLDEKNVKCTLCPHYCKLGDGQTGLCKARKNLGGKLYALTYGKPVAMLILLKRNPFSIFSTGQKPFRSVVPDAISTVISARTGQSRRHLLMKFRLKQ